MGEPAPLTGPDLAQGVASGELPDGGTLLGHAQGEAVLLVRRGAAVHAIGASCSHYGAALAEGAFDATTVRCPWHHATFSLATGEALGAPALNPLPCWEVVEAGGRLVELPVESP